MKKLFVLLTLMVPLLLTAALGPNVSVAPDGKELKWEEGAWDFFIMHKSLIEQVTGTATTTAGNPQADTCIDPNIGSTYTLTSRHVPEDADVDRAFLIWLTGHDPDNLNTPTDNSVTLTFTNAEDPTLTLTREITASYQGMPRPTSQGGFEFETLDMPADTNTGETAVYTYRVDVTDFMKEIVLMGEQRGMKPGEAIYGDYNVKGMACSNHQNYLTTSGLVGGWALPFVYTSSHIAAKKIYIYHGLAAYRFEAAEITVSGFELPSEAMVRLGLLSFEGDPGLASSTGLNLFGAAEPEGLAIKGQHATSDYTLMSNDCNPFRTQDSTGFVGFRLARRISFLHRRSEQPCIDDKPDRIRNRRRCLHDRRKDLRGFCRAPSEGRHSVQPQDRCQPGPGLHQFHDRQRRHQDAGIRYPAEPADS